VKEIAVVVAQEVVKTVVPDHVKLQGVGQAALPDAKFLVSLFLV
jgi:hypothetical protein